MSTNSSTDLPWEPALACTSSLTWLNRRRRTARMPIRERGGVPVLTGGLYVLEPDPTLAALMAEAGI
jgi:hypothetical protein